MAYTLKKEILLNAEAFKATLNMDLGLAGITVINHTKAENSHQ